MHEEAHTRKMKGGVGTRWENERKRLEQRENERHRERGSERANERKIQSFVGIRSTRHGGLIKGLFQSLTESSRGRER